MVSGYQYTVVVTCCCHVGCQLDAVERVIFCLFLPVDVQCYSVWMSKYFPVSAGVTNDASSSGGTGK